MLPQQVTGADVYSVCSNAWLSAARRGIQKIEIGICLLSHPGHRTKDTNFAGNKPDLPLEVDDADFHEGVAEMVPSLTPSDMKYYAQMASSTR